jgi:hypothetical protein
MNEPALRERAARGAEPVAPMEWRGKRETVTSRATVALVQICLCHVNVAIDLPGLPQIPAPATDQSCAATSPANTLIGVGCPHPPPSRANLHSARGATACHFPRVPSLKAFGRRPRCKPHRCDWPASETLNNSGLTHRSKRQQYSIILSASVNNLSGRPLDRALLSLSLVRARAE